MLSRVCLSVHIISIILDGDRRRMRPREGKRFISSGFGSVQDGMSSALWPVQFNSVGQPCSGSPPSLGSRMYSTWRMSVSSTESTGSRKSSAAPASSFRGPLHTDVAHADGSLMFMFEVQPSWYHIRPFDSLGWHVGFWNLVGALGFTLCGAFGIAQDQRWAFYQSGCSTFWGGWAFLIGSICQWIECLNR